MHMTWIDFCYIYLSESCQSMIRTRLPRFLVSCVPSKSTTVQQSTLTVFGLLLAILRGFPSFTWIVVIQRNCTTRTHSFSSQPISEYFPVPLRQKRKRFSENKSSNRFSRAVRASRPWRYGSIRLYHPPC